MICQVFHLCYQSISSLLSKRLPLAALRRLHSRIHNLLPCCPSLLFLAVPSSPGFLIRPHLFLPILPHLFLPILIILFHMFSILPILFHLLALMGMPIILSATLPAAEDKGCKQYKSKCHLPILSPFLLYFLLLYSKQQNSSLHYYCRMPKIAVDSQHFACSSSGLAYIQDLLSQKGAFSE